MARQLGVRESGDEVAQRDELVDQQDVVGQESGRDGGVEFGLA